MTHNFRLFSSIVFLSLFSTAGFAKSKTVTCANANIEQALASLHTEGYWMRDSGEEMTAEFLKSAMKVKDIKNGYASVEHDEFIHTYTAALFKGKEQSHLLVSMAGGSVDRLFAYKCESPNWVKDDELLAALSPEALPLYKKAGLIGATMQNGKKLTEAELAEYAGTLIQHVLPRVGRKIVLKAGYDDSKIYGKILGSLEFNGQAFVLKK